MPCLEVKKLEQYDLDLKIMVSFDWSYALTHAQTRSIFYSLASKISKDM